MIFKGIDRSLLIITVILILTGFFVFTSASLGLLARDGASFSSVITSQLGLGLVLGLVGFLIALKLPYRLLRPLSYAIFGIALVLTVLVFVPGIGLSHNGATRWLLIGSFSFQPAEFLKLGYVLALAAWFSSKRGDAATIRGGLAPYLLFTALAGGFLLAQPDTGTFLVIAAAGTAMYLSAGAQWKHIGIVILAALIGLAVLAQLRPYVMDRLETFFDPTHDPSGQSYQLQQSLIAVGSGGIFGRGFGQSIQKLTYLPEPIGDSIFAVYAEEFGFLGGVFLLTLFVLFALRGYKIASRSRDLFGGLLVVGLTTLIVVQSLVNIGAMIGIFPLTGVPLLFVSHGGTALLFALFEVGLILSISRTRRV